MMRWWIAALAVLMVPAGAEAFCGFYVSGADAKLFNNATQVVLMRDGTRTVLSMQNNYQGPPKDFAMVVPVPQVLKEENVKTLPKSVFDRVDKLGAPRLVKYFEQDPCYRPRPRRLGRMRKSRAMPRSSARGMGSAGPPPKVVVEAKFAVGEYDIVILSATDSSALDTWLRQNGYKIPAGAEKVLRPYVASDMKFFVAKVNIKKVKYDKSGKTLLSPLRFWYDSDEFMLPIRLGLLNSKGKQDLIVNILAKNKRYKVANYKNVFIPTNLRVRRRTEREFGRFYASLFDAVMRRNPKSVVTEYSWQASKCDPCPGGGFRGLSNGDIMTLGADVIGAGLQVAGSGPAVPGTRPSPRRIRRRRRMPRRFGGSGWVLTRLHTRYSKRTLGDDLVFEAAKPVVGGRGTFTGRALPHGVKKSSVNTFQGRYYILQRWRGPVSCKNPKFGRWGGPPRGNYTPKAAPRSAFVKRRTRPSRYFAQSVPEMNFYWGRTRPSYRKKKK